MTLSRKKPKPMPLPWIAKMPSQTGRKRPNQKFYNSKRWRLTSKAVERRDGYICQQCLMDGVITDAAGRNGATDHRIQLNVLLDTGGDPFDKNNLWRLCKSCHARKSGRERWITTSNETDE